MVKFSTGWLEAASSLWRRLSGASRCLIAAGMLAVVAGCATTDEGGPQIGRPTSAQSGPTDIARASSGAAGVAEVNRKPGITPPFMADRAIVRVGLLLPFSHSNPSVRDEASALLNAAQLAVFEHGDRHFLLLPRDSGATAQSAEAAARGLMEQGADLILGPLFGSQAAAVNAQARNGAAPVLSFSNDRSVAGQGVYVMGLAIEDEVARMVEFSTRKGMISYALLAPENDYGRRVESALALQVGRSQARVDSVRFFQRDSNAMMTPAKEVATALKAGPRGKQAVLLAERGTLLRALAPLIPFNGVTPNRDVKLIGLSSWGEDDVSKEPALRGGWYVSADPTARQKFEESYQAAFNRKPTRLSSIAYDAASLAARLAAARGREGLSRRALESPNGFIGVDGLFRLRPDGGVDRGLAILEIGETGPKVIDPAPRTFVTPPVG